MSRKKRNRTSARTFRPGRTSSRRSKKKSNWVAMLFIEVLAVVAFVGVLSAAQKARLANENDRNHNEATYNDAVQIERKNELRFSLDEQKKERYENRIVPKFSQNIRSKSFEDWQ